MKKKDILYVCCWGLFMAGFFSSLVRLKNGLPICIISLVTISIFDWIKLKKKNETSNEVYYSDFKMLYCEVVLCLAFAFVFVWGLLHGSI